MKKSSRGLGERLEEYCLAEQIGRAELARRLHSTEATVSRLINRKTKSLSERLRNDLAELLQVSVREIVALHLGEGSPAPSDPESAAEKPSRSSSTFVSEVALLLRLQGFDVKQDTSVKEVRTDLLIEKRECGLRTQIAVECVDRRIGIAESLQIRGWKKAGEPKLPLVRWIAVSRTGFEPAAKAALEEDNIGCTTYGELLSDVLPLDKYVQGLLTENQEWRRVHWGGGNFFVAPHITENPHLPETRQERRLAPAYFAEWRQKPGENFLAVVGDLGTGKTTLSRFLVDDLARNFRDDPLHNPAPVFIALREVRKAIDLETIVINHFARRGFPGISYPRFKELLRQGKIVLFLDGFDEMDERFSWKIAQQNYTELRRAAEGSGKVVLTCRTHFFSDAGEQMKVMGMESHLNQADTELYKQMRPQRAARVVSLREFNAGQIQAYLRLARPQTADNDWQIIQRTLNLEELARRPLLLDMIVNSLASLEADKPVNPVSLYNVYTSLWIEREETKGRLLSRQTKGALMQELAWRMWSQGVHHVHYRELVPFVKELIRGKAVEVDEEPEEIAREMQLATFLNRDYAGNFSFLHPSFRHYFLARKVLESALGQCAHSPSTRGEQQALTTHGRDDSESGSGPTQDELRAERKLRVLLNTRRLDREVVGFVALMDEANTLRKPLQLILTSAYTHAVSENALQMLYWSGRVRAGMEKTIDDIAKLGTVLREWLPTGAHLAGANLKEFVLEAATFVEADFTDANLDGAILHHAVFERCTMNHVRLRKGQVGGLWARDTSWREADLTGTIFANGSFEGCDFTGTVPDRPMGAPQEAWDGDSRRTIWEPVVQRGAASGITALAWSRQHDLIASGSVSGVVRLYGAGDGQLLRVIEGHTDRIHQLAFDRAGRLLASASADGTVKLWEAASGRLVRVLSAEGGPAFSVAFHPDGTRVATGDDSGTVKLWEFESGGLLETLRSQSGTVFSLAFDPAGKLLASGRFDQSVQLWRLDGGRGITTLKGHRKAVYCVAVDPAGRILASGGDDDSVKLWDLASGNVLTNIITQHSSVYSLAIDPSGRVLASGGHDGTVKLWEMGTGRALGTLVEEPDAGRERVSGVAFDPSGCRLASAAHDRTVRIWDVGARTLAHKISGHDAGIGAVAFDPSGRLLACGGEDRTVKLWDAAKGQWLRTLPGHADRVRGLAFDPSGRILASCGRKTIKLWEADTGGLIHTLKGVEDEVQDKVRCVTFAPKGQTLVSGSDDKSLRVWNVASRQEVRKLEGHKSGVLSAAFDPEGGLLASGSEDRTVRLWQTGRWETVRVLEGHRDKVRSVAFSPSGDLVASGSADSTIKLWKAADGHLLRTFTGHRKDVFSVAFHPEGQMLASGGWDHEVRLWSVNDGALLKTLRCHLGSVFQVRFAPNGKYLVAAGAGGRLQFWDLEKGQTFLYLYVFNQEAWLALLPDGRFDGSPAALPLLRYTEKNTLKSCSAKELAKEFYNPKAIQEAMGNYLPL